MRRHYPRFEFFEWKRAVLIGYPDISGGFQQIDKQCCTPFVRHLEFVRFAVGGLDASTDPVCISHPVSNIVGMIG